MSFIAESPPSPPPDLPVRPGLWSVLRPRRPPTDRWLQRGLPVLHRLLGLRHRVLVEVLPGDRPEAQLLHQRPVLTVRESLLPHLIDPDLLIRNPGPVLPAVERVLGRSRADLGYPPPAPLAGDLRVEDPPAPVLVVPRLFAPLRGAELSPGDLGHGVDRRILGVGRTSHVVPVPNAGDGKDGPL